MDHVRISTGTTIIAAECDGGVVLGADSRASAGRYVVDRVADKLTRLTDKIYCCRSGSAGDTEAIADHVSCLLKHREFSIRKPTEVHRAACEVRNYCYKNRQHMIAGIIVAGWDAKCGGQVYDIPLGGLMTRSSCAVGGSGSPYIRGYVRQNYKPGMAVDKCIEFVKTAVKAGIHFDTSSGGVVRIAVIDKDGMKRHIFYNTDSGEPEVPSRRTSFT